MHNVTAARVRFHDQLADATAHDRTAPSFLDEILAGLTDTPRRIDPKHFYDQRGSELFDRICVQPEYYPTRTELMILEASAPEIAELAGPDATLIELGSGASRKVRCLLETLRPRHYLGIDISRDFLLESTTRLAEDYPWLDVHAACADFTRPLHMPAPLADAPHPVAFFPGSSIGNFDPDQAEHFLRGLHDLLPAGGGLLVGVDLIKDPAVLEAAYNDAAGATREFNLNLLTRLKNELGAVISPGNFNHLAFYNQAVPRIEMHLVSRLDQRVVIGDTPIELVHGEHIHTENSWKYSLEGFQQLAGRAGFVPRQTWTDQTSTDREPLFSVHYLQRESTTAMSSSGSDAYPLY